MWRRRSGDRSQLRSVLRLACIQLGVRCQHHGRAAARLDCDVLRRSAAPCRSTSPICNAQHSQSSWLKGQSRRCMNGGEAQGLGLGTWQGGWHAAGPD